MSGLPVDALKERFLATIDRCPVVVSSPTGSGKSTQLPRWCAVDGPALVVEPRRVAAQGLAQRVAEFEGARLGDQVGYVVRDDARAHASTRIVFATPGVALRWVASGQIDRFRTVLLDEFHERTLEVDLLYALLGKRPPPRRVVMSATLDGVRIAAHLGGEHLSAEGRRFPVATRYLGSPEGAPSDRDLERRVARAVAEALDGEGDVLVFLPGKSELIAARDALRVRDVDVLLLHGQLPLQEQAQVFHPGAQRRVILSTNVAETSLTVPRIGAVVDAGLVRRTRYHQGRGFLTLSPIAMDSADQRAGRAGRLGPGRCLRLWDERAVLAPSTPPELHRESLTPLLLAAAAAGEPGLDLPFLDAPRPYAVDDARAELTILDALDDDGLTERGRAIFGLPLPASLARFVLQAQDDRCLDDAIDLVAALSTRRPLLRRQRPDPDPLREGGCDATAHLRALRTTNAYEDGVEPAALAEARSTRARLRNAWGLFESAPTSWAIDRRRLVICAMRADPRTAYVARKRGQQIAWANGGTEVQLGRSCAVDTDVPAVVVWASAAMGRDRDNQVMLTAVTPAPLAWLAEAGVGRDQVVAVQVSGGVITATLERVFAGKTLATETGVPKGASARDALYQLLVRGSLFAKTVRLSRERLADAALWARLEGREPPLDADAWLRARVERLGFESGDDLALLSDSDFLADPLPDDISARITQAFPRQLALPDATYRLEYEPVGRTCTLVKVAGTRKMLPPLQFVPPLPGWRLVVRDKSNERVLRDRARSA